MKTLLLTLLVSISIYAQGDIKIVEKEGELYKVAFFHENGEISQTGFIDSNKQMQGVWTLYSANGNKKSQGEYADGKKVGRWFFEENSDKVTIVKFGDDHKIASVYDSQPLSKFQLADSDIEE